MREFYKKIRFFESFYCLFQSFFRHFLQKMTEKFDPFYIGKDGEKTCQKMSKVLWPIFLHNMFSAILAEGKTEITDIRGFYKKHVFFEIVDYIFQGFPDLFWQKMTEKFDPFYIGKDGEKTCQKMPKILWPVFSHRVFRAIIT